MNVPQLFWFVRLKQWHDRIYVLNKKKIVFADLQSVPKTAFQTPNREIAHHCEGGKRKSKGTLKFKLQTSYTEQFFFLRQLPWTK